MPTARRDVRGDQQAPDLHSPASCLSEEAIDLICAFVRDDDDTATVTQTLRSLALTARRFLSSAVRALWFDPTRVIKSHGSWDDMQLCLEALLISPHLGNYIHSLRHLPAIYDIVGYEGLSDRDFHVWCWTVMRLAPRIQAVGIMPWSDSDCCKALAGNPHIRDLSLDLPDGVLEAGFLATARQVSTFLQECGVRHLRFLGLPQLEGDTGDSLFPASLLTIEVEHIHVQDALEQMSGSALHHYIRFEGVRTAIYRASEFWGLDPDSFRAMSGGPIELIVEPEHDDLPVMTGLRTLPTLPNLTTLRLRHIRVLLHDLEQVPLKMPALQTLEFIDCRWGECEHSQDLWLEFLPSALQLRTVSFSACRSVSLDIDHFASLCDVYGVRFTWQPRRRLRRGRSATIASDQHDLDGPPSRTSWISAPPAQALFEGVPPVALQASASRDDGALYDWAFDEHGRPVAIPYDPDDLRFCPTPSEYDYDYDYAYDYIFSDDIPEQYLDEPDYLPAPPDEPRIEPDFEAVEPDNEDDSCSSYAPWLGWSDPCDIGAADAAWAAYDINDRGQEKIRKRRRWREAIELREVVRAFLADHTWADCL